MKLLNRELQRQLLSGLAETYPEPRSSQELGMEPDDRRWVVNIMYLTEHDLVEAQLSRMLGAPACALEARITHKGLDFLQDDGGLSAVLNTVIVRLEAETLRALIQEKIDATPMPDAERSKLMAWLKSAGSEALKETTQRLVGAALDHLPEALQLLRTQIG